MIDDSFNFSSLNFVKFTTGRHLISSFPLGAEQLARKLKAVEKQLVKTIRCNIGGQRKTFKENYHFYQIYNKLGHINLLAEDFARALSAYQKAYKYNRDNFWKEQSSLYGLAMCYYHFRVYHPAIELFCQLLFVHPYSEVATEVNARLGLCFKALDNFPQALKHLNIALEDTKECLALPKFFLRFQIAHCFDVAVEVRRAVEEYRRLLSDHDRSIVPLNNQLLSAIYGRLGWISLCSREREPREEIRLQKLKEAEALLQRARELQPVDSKANCYSGLCFSEQTRVANKFIQENNSGKHQQRTNSNQQNNQNIPRYNPDHTAQNAFVSYRTAIDSDESDANTWRSIGILYQEQSQPSDALESFACSVQLNNKHYAAWLDLGQLYEKHRQYNDSLFCYEKALQANPEPPEQLYTRIYIIQREFNKIGGSANYTYLAEQHYALLLDKQKQLQQSYRQLDPLSHIECAWQLGIPAQVRQRLLELKKQQENKYREGSILFNMHDLIASSMKSDTDERSLTPTQRQIMQILKFNQDQLEFHESTLLHELEQRVGDTHEGTSTTTHVDEAISVQEEQPTLQPKCSPGTKPLPSSFELAQNKSPKSPIVEISPALVNLIPFPSSMLSPKEESSTSHNYHQQSFSSPGPHYIQEEKISSTSNHLELPPNLSLLAPVYLPVTVTSTEVLDMCKKRLSKPEEYKPIFDENFPPPKEPVPPPNTSFTSKENLLLKTPVVLVENQREAMAIELQRFCYTQPIVLIHGLTLALKIDLSQFSTKTLIQTAADHEVEVRTQYKMPYDVNVDQMGNPTWSIRSSKSFTTISRFGQYQAESFKHSLKEETEKLKQSNPKLYGSSNIPSCSSLNSENIVTSDTSPIPNKKQRKIILNNNNGTPTNNSGNSEKEYKMIKFGTNVDLSDEKKFSFQLKELNKLPPFCRITSASNMLSYLGHTVFGMNTVQLYLKVPGCRTPGHLENNSFASVNVNIGPGECEWFGVPYEYWPALAKMCKDRNIDFLRGAWWPSVADLIKADLPFYRFTQRAGDVVWVNGGCVHWVQSTGWCNNVAWNVGPMTANQIEMALTAYEWNRLNSFRSLVPMQHLCWALAKDVRFSNQKLYNNIKNMLIRSLAYCQMLVDFVGTAMKSPIKMQQKQKGECAHYCHLCEIEVFNILFVKEISGKWKIFCFKCAKRNNLDEYVVLQQYPFEELQLIFDRFQLQITKPTVIC
uniref:JmjC domain-containing protein n=1 Tax=Meloidogyne javanica TaxID=6303 RepID=A0A915MYF2_MELJA